MEELYCVFWLFVTTWCSFKALYADIHIAALVLEGSNIPTLKRDEKNKDTLVRWQKNEFSVNVMAEPE